MRVTRNAYTILAGKSAKKAIHLKIMVEAWVLDFVRKPFSRETWGLAFVCIATSIPPTQSDTVTLKSTLILSFHPPLFSPVFSILQVFRTVF
jgi:glutamine amidotransferase PdxT